MGTWLLVAFVYASQYLAGDLVVRGLWRSAPPRPLERAARALLLGPAALAAQMIAMSLVAIPFSLLTVLGPWWVAAAVVLLRRRARGPSATPPGTTALASEGASASGVARASGGARAALALLAAVAVLLFGVLTWLGLRTPVFESDPINNYSLAARLFETHRGLAGEAIANLRAVGHVEYPPLVALNEALLFMAAGEERLRAVMPFFALPWLALQWLVISAACGRLRWALAVPVALIVILVPELFALGTVGLADLRLAACVLLLGLEGRRLLLQPGAATAARYAAAAAACALTKNEGIVVAAVAILPLLGLTVRRRLGAGAGLGAMLLWLAASTVWVGYLALSGVQTGYWKQEAVGDLSQGVGERFLMALEGFAGFSLSSMTYSSFYGVLWQAGVVAAVIGLLRRASHRETFALLLALAVHVGLYALLLAVVAQSMEWSLQASGLRLFTHTVAWPILLLVTALAGWPAGRSEPA